jgi:hypothetical protein
MTDKLKQSYTGRLWDMRKREKKIHAWLGEETGRKETAWNT